MTEQQKQAIIESRESLCKDWCELQDRTGASELLQILFYAIPLEQLREIIENVKSNYLAQEENRNLTADKH